MYFGKVLFALDLMLSFLVLLCFRDQIEIFSFVAAAKSEIESLVLKTFFLFGVWLQKGVWLDCFENHFITIVMRFNMKGNVAFWLYFRFEGMPSCSQVKSGNIFVGLANSICSFVPSTRLFASTS